MAGFKKFAKKYMKRKAAKKRYGRGKGTKNIAKAVHSFKRSVYVPAWRNTIPLADTTFVFAPQLTDVPNSGEFTTLFDQYRITGVSFKMVPRFNSTDSEATVTPGVPLPPSQILSCLDYDGNGPTTLQDILQYQTVKMTRGMGVHTRFFKPAILNMAYQSPLTTAYIPKWGQFIDTANPTVPHYGLYGIIPATGQAYMYDLYATYYIQCKNVR